MQKKLFTFDGFKPSYIGYTEGRRWNGWATPYFEKKEALCLMADYNKSTESPMYYSEENDTFYHFGTDNYSGEMWRGADYETADGIKHLYPIGAYCWIWDDVNDEDIHTIAQGIEDFLWELDTYEHRDQYTDRNELVEAIQSQLNDLNVLKQVCTIFYNEDLTEEEIYAQLGKELTV